MEELKRFAFREGFGSKREDYSKKLDFSYVKITHEWKEDTKDIVGDIWWSGSFNGKIINYENDSYTAIDSSGKLKAFIDNYSKMQELKKTLLSFGGDNVCLPDIEDDLENIISRGQFWLAKKGRIKRMTGERCQCHRNSCALYLNNKDNFDIRICTGYALASDGLWRQHSWLVAIEDRKTKIIETTVKWGAYYGFIMTKDECEKFIIDCCY